MATQLLLFQHIFYLSARTFKTMKKTCELRGKYLEGALPGDRMPTFVSASEAYEACKEGKIHIEFYGLYTPVMEIS